MGNAQIYTAKRWGGQGYSKYRKWFGWIMEGGMLIKSAFPQIKARSKPIIDLDLISKQPDWLYRAKPSYQPLIR
jgi:hypothetical protein